MDICWQLHVPRGGPPCLCHELRNRDKTNVCGICVIDVLVRDIGNGHVLILYKGGLFRIAQAGGIFAQVEGPHFEFHKRGYGPVSKIAQGWLGTYFELYKKGWRAISNRTREGARLERHKGRVVFPTAQGGLFGLHENQLSNRSP